MRKTYTTPAGEFSPLYADMLEQTHLLIAGATGSGKSTVVNGIMQAALMDSPVKRAFILIDPKGTELSDYANIPHCVAYAQKTDACIDALRYALKLTEKRFEEMKRARVKEYTGAHVYVVIDELMFLLNRPAYKKQVIDLLQDILVIARAARVHVIACTQFIPAIPTCLRCNFDCKLGLRTATSQDSRNVIGVKGCEKFPDPKKSGVAYGMYLRGANMDLYKLPLIPYEWNEKLIAYWKSPAGRGRIAR